MTLANEGEHRESVRVLKELLDEQPGCYSAYSLYWRTLGKTDGPEAVLVSHGVHLGSGRRRERLSSALEFVKLPHLQRLR